MPTSQERIDLIILGKSESKAKALILELKGWGTTGLKSGKWTVKVDKEEGYDPHLQLQSYVEKLRFFHSASQAFDFDGLLWFYGVEPAAQESEYTFVGPCYNLLSNRVASLLHSALDEGGIRAFLCGEYVQSSSLFSFVKERGKDILQRGLDVLVETAFSPSEEQAKLIERVIRAMERGERVNFLVKGGPGSGKTYLALILMIEAVRRGYRTVIAYRNNRFVNSLRKLLDSVERGLSGLVKFYSTGRRDGIAEQYGNCNFEFVIYDEAQRMRRENIRIAMQKGKINLFFYDDSQILNADEEGWRENFLEEARLSSLKVEEFQLEGSYRVRGGHVYTSFVEGLLESDLHIDPRSLGDYELKLFERIEEMLSLLRKKACEGYRVALIAAFTESPGDRKNKTGKL